MIIKTTYNFSANEVRILQDALTIVVKMRAKFGDNVQNMQTGELLELQGCSIALQSILSSENDFVSAVDLD